METSKSSGVAKLVSVNVHNVKSWKKWFSAIVSGERTADIRLNDRDYKVGDLINFKEWDPFEMEYTGKEAMCRITFIIENGSSPCAMSPVCLNDGYAVLSIRLILVNNQ